MRFLLINPFYPLSENPSPPLGLAFLAAALEQAGVQVRILDFVVCPYSARLMAEVLDDFAPDLVGATSVTMNFYQALSVLDEVKRLAPEIITVMGGPHVTFQAEETINQYAQVDVIVLGEGEQTVVDLVRAVDLGQGYERIPGLAYRSGKGIRFTKARPPGLDVNSLPRPARHLLPLGRYRALGLAISMTTSRGCPFKCIFCVGRKMVGARVRYRNPGQVVDELESLDSLGFPQINLADDLFTADKQHCLAVCHEIIRRGLEVKWTSFARVDTVSPEILSAMKQAGCSAVSFGIESGNPDILRIIRKGITLEQVIEAVQMCTSAGLTPHASFILGLPGETPETLKQTVAFGQKLKAMGVAYGFHLLAPFPGTVVCEESESLGLNILTRDWSQYHANRAVVETASVTGQMMDQVVLNWEQEFDDYLGFLKEGLETGQIEEKEAWPLINLERTVLTYDLMMKEAVERLGTWPAPDGRRAPDNSLRELCRRLEGSVPGTKKCLYDTLDQAAARGDLRCVRRNGWLHWEWVDYI